MSQTDVRPHALITGASSGIGAAYARQLAPSHDLTLVARRQDRLAALAAELPTQATVLAADLTDPAGLAQVVDVVASRAPDLLVNNAGFGRYAPVAETDPQQLEAMILLNVVALVQLSRAALPGLLARGRGDLINVASGLAFLPGATRATYSGTKAFVVNFSRALHEEVAGRGLRVQVLCPGLIRTEFHDVSGTDLSRVPASMVMSAEALVAASLRGLELGELVCIPALTDLGQLRRFEALQAELAQGFVRNGTPAERYTR